MIEITDEMVDVAITAYVEHTWDPFSTAGIRAAITAAAPLIAAAIRADDVAKWRYSPGYVSRGRDDERQG